MSILSVKKKNKIKKPTIKEISGWNGTHHYLETKLHIFTYSALWKNGQVHLVKIKYHNTACYKLVPQKSYCTWKIFIFNEIHKFSSVQLLSCVWLFATPWITARQASLSITNSWSLVKLMPIESVMPSSHLILCHPLLLPPPIPPSSREEGFQWVSSSDQVAKVLVFQPQHQSFQWTPRTDLLEDVLAVQGTLKSLLQHHSSEASTFQCSAFFTVQLSHPYMTTGKP